MTTWHQDQRRNIGLPGPGYVIVSDGYNELRTRMSFGNEREIAFDSLKKHRTNQPHLHHYLYHNGKLIA